MAKQFASDGRDRVRAVILEHHGETITSEPSTHTGPQATPPGDGRRIPKGLKEKTNVNKSTKRLKSTQQMEREKSAHKRQARYKYGYGDGFAFFLAPFDSKLSNASIGGTLGLTGGAHGLNTINSLRSVRTIPWAADVMGGRRSEAWISYDSSTRNLSVAVSGFVRDVGIDRLSAT
ncbi:Galactose-binding lectin [Linum perenne]